MRTRNRAFMNGLSKGEVSNLDITLASTPALSCLTERGLRILARIPKGLGLADGVDSGYRYLDRVPKVYCTGVNEYLVIIRVKDYANRVIWKFTLSQVNNNLGIAIRSPKVVPNNPESYKDIKPLEALWYIYNDVITNTTCPITIDESKYSTANYIATCGGVELHRKEMAMKTPSLELISANQIHTVSLQLMDYYDTNI